MTETKTVRGGRVRAEQVDGTDGVLPPGEGAREAPARESEARFRRDAELEVAREAISGSKRLTDQIVGELRDVREALAKERDDARSLDLAHRRSEERAARFEKDAEGSRREAIDLSALLKNVEAQRDRLAVEEEGSRRLRDELSERVRVLLEENGRAVRSLDGASARGTDLASRLEQSSSDAEAALKDLEKARKENLSLSGETTRLKVARDTLALEEAALRRRCALLEERNDSLAVRADAAAGDADSLRSRLEAAESRWAMARDAARTLASAATLVGSEVVGRKVPGADEADLTEVLQAVEGLCWALRDEATARKTVSDGHETTIRTLQIHLASASEDARRNETRLVLSERSGARADERITRLERQLEAARAAQAKAESRAEALRRRIAELVE
ncbi:MAG: hypothetical protein HY608_10565 [Planctomycetes bacterium]|nr:hypothetical protein [Planctomycetota bacterium]